MKTLFAFSMIFILFTMNGIAQVLKPNNTSILHLKEFDEFLYPQKCPDTIIKRINDLTSIKIYINNRRGASRFYTFNSKNQVMIEGQYSGATKVSKIIVDSISATGDLVKRNIIFCYEPVKSGKWVNHQKKR